MRFSRMFAVTLRQYYLIRGSMSRVVPLFAWVAVDMVLWGFITKYLNTVSQAEFNFVPVLLGAVLLWDFFARVMQGVTMAFFEDVWARNFLNVFGSPITLPEYLGGLVLSSIATSSVGLLVMLLLATSVFGLPIFVYGLTLLPFLLVLFLFGISFGILACALVLRLGPASEWFVWPIPSLLSPFVGVFYPLATLPPWMQAVSRVLPPSYVFEGLRAVVRGEPAPYGLLGWGAALAVGYIVLAGWVFTHVYANARRSGLIARYSAESVS